MFFSHEDILQRVWLRYVHSSLAMGHVEGSLIL